MNKKYLMFGMMGLFVMALVSAGSISYYGSIEQDIDIESPIVLEGNNPLEIVGFSGEQKIGDTFAIKNNAPFEVETLISNDAPDGVEVEYVGTLELTKKDTTSWEATDEKLEITYTVVGDSLEFSGVTEGYTLVYYKDAVIGLEGRVSNPQPVIIVSSDMGNLPQQDDANADLSSDYCNNDVDNYESCRGAKLWVVPSTDIVDGDFNWANMADYYYETNLIQYNAEGNIVVYSEESLDVTPVYYISGSYFGEDIITTEVSPTA